MKLGNQQKKYCYDHAVKPGSPFYYSLRSLTSAERDVTVAVHAFYNELEAVVFSSQEPNVIAAKITWWRAEILRDAPDHPVLVFLKKFNVSQEKLLALVDGIAERIYPTPFANFEDVVIHLMRTAGVRELLLAKTSSAEVVYQLMLVVELTHYLQHLRYYLQHNIIYFPTDEMVKFGVTFAMLSQLKMTAEIQHLLQFQAEKIERAYQVAQAQLTQSARQELSSLLIRGEIARVTLREIQASDFSVLENLISLTPLRCWWVAWRVS